MSSFVMPVDEISLHLVPRGSGNSDLVEELGRQPVPAEGVVTFTPGVGGEVHHVLWNKGVFMYWGNIVLLMPGDSYSLKFPEGRTFSVVQVG